MADALEAIRQGVQEEAADELRGGKRHDLGLAALAIVAPAEADATLFKLDQPAVGDCDTVRVAAEIGEHLRGTAKGTLGVDHPVDAAPRGQTPSEDRRLQQVEEGAEETELVGLEGSSQTLEGNSLLNRAESTRTGRKKQGRAATHRVPSGDGPPPGTTQWTWG